MRNNSQQMGDLSHQKEDVFPKLTVYEKLFSENMDKEKEINLDFVFEIFPRLKERINQRGGTLSGGNSKCFPRPS